MTTSGRRASTATDAAGAAAGFTLLEVIVALGLFALIASAGVTMLDAILGVERRTAGQLARLGRLQRAMFLLTHDFDGIVDGRFEGSRSRVRFDRRGADGGPLTLRYAVAGAVLQRTEAGRTLAVLDGITAARWSYFARGSGWQDHWPATGAQAAEWPIAAAIDLQLAPGYGGLGGRLRRVVRLPAGRLAPGPAVPRAPGEVATR